MIPYCHGEKMVPTFRYLGSNGKIFITYQCMFCGNKEEIELEVEGPFDSFWLGKIK
jgi:hypothetical protein